MITTIIYIVTFTDVICGILIKMLDNDLQKIAVITLFYEMVAGMMVQLTGI